jgi:glucose-1-phosphate adenylyltransferase
MRVVAMIMAGGEGTRLSVLSEERAKPSVPFAGKFRIIDFTLSNCINSGIFDVAVLTQYRPHSLNQHIGIGKPWDLDRNRGGVVLRQPYLARNETGWYRGTSDAVYQNLEFADERRADVVLVLSGDHIYKMDYTRIIEYHRRQRADVTVAVMEVPLEMTHQFGIMTTNDEEQIVEFSEKPKNRDKGNLASMGVYVFNTETLVQRLSEGSEDDPRTDFGHHVIPAMIADSDRVFAYRFKDYWVDVGTIKAYWQTNLELLDPACELNLFDPNWVIRTRSEERPPAKFGPQARVQRSILCNGCVIRGVVENSVLSPGVYVSPGAVVRDSVVMNDTWIGPNAVLDQVVVDKQVVVGSGVQLGVGDDMDTPNEEQPNKLDAGISVVGKRAQIPSGIKVGRNVLVNAERQEEDFPGGDIPSGATI